MCTYMDSNPAVLVVAMMDLAMTGLCAAKSASACGGGAKRLDFSLRYFESEIR